MEQREATFLSALEAWRVAEERRILTGEEYREAHARAFRAQEKATDAARKAYADETTSKLRLDRDFAESAAMLAHHRVVFYRGSAGEREVVR